MLLPAAFLLLLSSRGGDIQVSTSVSYVTRGADVPHAVEELGKAAGVPLSAPKAFRTDILAIRLDKAPLSEAMNRIAQLTAGDWVKKGEGYELVRSTEKQHADEKAEADRELDVLRKGIDAKKKELAKLEAWNEQTANSVAAAIADAQKGMGDDNDWNPQVWEKVEKADRRAPGGRAMTRILAALDPEELAKLPDDYRIVYSDRPNRLQRPMPAAAAQALVATKAEQNLWSEVMQSRGESENEFYYGNSMLMRNPFEGQLGKTLLVICKQRNYGFVFATVELIMTNTKGKVIVRANESISAFNDRTFQEPKPQEGEQPIQPSPLSQAIGEMNGAREEMKPLPAEIVEKLLNPEKNEPLALSLGYSLISVAEARRCNLIASLSDESFTWGSYASTQKVTPSMLLYTLGQIAMDVEDKDGWLGLAPKARATARSTRADRSSVGKYVRSVFAKGKPSLDDLAAYALSIPDEIYTSMGYLISNALLRHQQQVYYETDMLRFYGLLSPTQRQMLLRGQSIALSALTPAESQLLDKMIFGQSYDIQPVQEPNGEIPVDFESFYDGIRREPTEMFVNGFPPRSVLKVVDSTAHVAGVSSYENSPGIYYGGGAMDANELAQRLYAKERPGIFPWMDSEPGLDALKFRYGSQRTLQFNFEFGNVARMSKALQDHDYGNANPGSYDQLPEEFRKEVQERLKEMRESYKDMKPGDFGGSRRQSPPPPTASMP